MGTKCSKSVHNHISDDTSHLTAATWLGYSTILLDMPNIHVQRCTVLNPATLLLPDNDGEPYNCVAAIVHVCSAKVDLKETSIDNADWNLFVDGSVSCDPDTG